MVESKYYVSYSDDTINFWIHTYTDNGIIPTETSTKITDKKLHEKVLSELHKKISRNMSVKDAEKIFTDITSSYGLSTEKTVKDRL